MTKTAFQSCLALIVLASSFACADPESAHVDAMAREHTGDSPVASPVAKESPSLDVQTEEVAYATLDGTEVTGYTARPAGADGSRAAVILIHEWWGLNDNIRAVADRFAGEGYVALAVDLYEGEVAADRDGARALMQATLERRERLEHNLRQARDFLVNRAGAVKIGTVGWCFGGGWSLNAAIHLGDDLDAAIIYYGRVTDDRERLAAVEAPVLGLFGSEDRGIPVDSVRAFESAMTALGKSIEVHVYEGANHAFANPSGTRYDEATATDAWKKTLAFFAEHLW